MIKIRINLLPREVKDKQKIEKFLFLTILGIAVIAGLLGSLYTINVWKINEAQSKVALLQTQTAKLNESIQSLRLYEQKLKDVQMKKQILDKAVSDQVMWSKILEELMVVAPGNVSLTLLSGSPDGITFNGETFDPDDNPDIGHKPVAYWLISLARIRPGSEVWLTSSERKGNSVSFVNTLKFKKSPMLPAPSNTSGK